MIVPMVNTPEDAMRAVEAAYYPPKGKRGVGLSRAQGYGVDFHGYQQRAMQDTVVMVQIEHVLGVQNLEKILAVEGIDGFIIGPYDLSGSLGQPGNFEHPEVLASLQRVTEVMTTASKPGGYHVVQTSREQLQQRIDQGISLHCLW